MTSYRIFDKLQQMMPPEDYFDHGVRMRLANFFFDEVLENMPDCGQLDKWLEISSQPDVCIPSRSILALTVSMQIRCVRRDPRLIKSHAVNQKAGVVDSYQHLAPIIDTDVYMNWLRFVLRCKGAVMHTRRLEGDLLDLEEDLLVEYGADVIVNATGLAGFDLAGDKSVYPLRGALIRVVNDGKMFPQVREALAVTHDDTRGEDEDIVFIVPRNDTTLILGGMFFFFFGGILLSHSRVDHRSRTTPPIRP